jgi:ribonuclease-3
MSIDELTLRGLEERVGYTFQERDLLFEALTHPSYTAERGGQCPNNQRLEFLGDAVIQIIVTTRLYLRHRNWPEGKMTKMRAVLSKKETFARFAKVIDLGPCLRLGRGEASSGGAELSSNLCDAFEALIGAIYLDTKCGLEAAQRIVNELIDAVMPSVEITQHDENPKGALQEWSQKVISAKPEYRVHKVSGPDHKRTFDVGVAFSDTCYGEGRGTKRQTAEEAAAIAALRKVRKGDGGSGAG